MAIGLIDKLTNFIMPEEDVEQTKNLGKTARYQNTEPMQDHKVHLQVHKPAALRVIVVDPGSFDDVSNYAVQLKSDKAVLINFSHVNAATQQRIVDFLNGVSFITGSHYQRISDSIVLYTPSFAEIGKELFSYSIPTYVKETTR